MAAGDLTIQFGTIGHYGIISSSYPSLSVTVKDSTGNPLNGVTISVTDPVNCPYYTWGTTPETADYLVTATSFPGFSIRDNFQFTFSKAGYNTKTVSQELAINSLYIEIMDENGVLQVDHSNWFEMNAIPSHVEIYNQFQTVYVNSVKYYVAQDMIQHAIGLTDLAT